MPDRLKAPELPDTVNLREEIIEACRYLSETGHMIGTWGNVSVRVEDGLLITPSRVDYSEMVPDDLVVVDWSGKKIKGERLASSETDLHRELLATRLDMGSVIHTHSPYASSVACAGVSIPVCVEDMAQVIGAEVRCSEYVPGGKHAELAEKACEAMGDESFAVLLANHGPVVGGRTLAEAVIASRVLEKAAFIYVTARTLGQFNEISLEAVCEERQRYLYKYGVEDGAR